MNLLTAWRRERACGLAAVLFLAALAFAVGRDAAGDSLGWFARPLLLAGWAGWIVIYSIYMIRDLRRDPAANVSPAPAGSG